MSTATEKATRRVALVGNPNTGKSTLFNALSGLRQRVGNYPGVTVETKVGTIEIDSRRFDLIDLPGTYSLAPQSPDEMVAIDLLLGWHNEILPPDAVIVIVDASNLERNLYLVSQVLELGLPTVIALNMIDVARSRDITVDVERLQRQLGVPVVPLQANRRIGLDGLRVTLAEVCDSGGRSEDRLRADSVFPAIFQDELQQMESRFVDPPMPRYLVERLILDCDGYLEQTLLSDQDEAVRTELAATRRRLAEAGHAVPGVEAMARYGWVDRVLDGVVTRPRVRRATWTDRIDKVITHKFWGTLIFVLLMLLVFRSVFNWAGPAMDGIAAAGDWLSEIVDSAMADGALKSLIIDGVIAGVGGVLVFLPQIFILFFFIAVLEDCGYMARAAYLMDKLMVRVGLSGKSFIPLLSSFACAIPGIMSARVIENRRDRLTTILVAPLMSCSARLPVYTLFIAAFIPQREWAGGVLNLQGLTMFAMYMLGIVVAVAMALFLKKTMLRGETPAFVMELPGYKRPSARVVLHRVMERGWAFVRRAGTLIFAVAVLVWAAAYYPHDPAAIDPAISAQLEEVEMRLSELPPHHPLTPGIRDALLDHRDVLRNEVAGMHLRNSYLGRAGQAIEPVVRPLGWDWKIGCAVLASFPAREVVVGTLGVIYNLGSETDEESVALQDKLKSARWPESSRQVFTVPVALSIMVFFALCAQCAATLVVIRRETGTWRWPLFTFVYMTTFAYIGALVTFQVGTWLIGS